MAECKAGRRTSTGGQTWEQLVAGWTDKKVIEIADKQIRLHTGPLKSATQRHFNRVVRREARRRGLY